MQNYKVKPIKSGWVIERPDGSHVNDIKFIDEYSARAYLERLEALHKSWEARKST